MLASVMVVGIALGVTNVLLVVEVKASQLSGVDRALRLELNSLVAATSNGSIPGTLQLTSQDTSFIQIVNASGHVLASSASVQGESRIAAFAPKGSGDFRTLSNLPIGSGDSYRVAATIVSTSGGSIIIYVGESLEAITHSVHAILVGLLVVDPILLIIVGSTVWWLIGRALSSVEAIRTEVEDITARALERRITEPTVHDEIGRLAVTMNAMLERLEASSRRQRAFVADASHELRSPLAAAQSELEVSLSHVASTDWPDSARIVLGDIERVRRIVEDLAILARSDEQTTEWNPRSVDLDELVLRECTRLQRIARVTIDASSVSGARVAGDPEHLGRAIRNLLDNAVRHARQQVSVTLSQDSEWAVLEIRDDGTGVSVEDRDRIFERFVRVDQSRARSSGGSGLGLAIVYEIVMAHGGTVEVTDARPGARFIVRLPRPTS
ncbi:MAG: HAMP domain-containing histidine kinase [Acidobacteria bacterium]|nr:HAMP domain-containing histidine kinase [Acidobacteriota bacterium]